MNKEKFNNLEEKYLNLIRKSELFDSDWYLSKYPDVVELNLDPIYHFLKYGTVLSRDPGPNFSSSFYYDIKGWVKRQGVNPLLHYLTRKKPNPPKPDNVLWAANKIVEKDGSYDLAISLAKENLPEDLHYSIEILKSNKYLSFNKETDWLNSFNRYLNNFSIKSLELKSDSSIPLLGRFFCDNSIKIESGPLVSVIIPVWNSEETVSYAIDSIINQTWTNLEIIIIDDCSTDGTWDILNKISKKDGRVKILRNKINTGPYVSKNLGLRIAEGQYITGHDGDDWAHPQRIEKHMEMISHNGFPRASLTHMIRIRPNGYFGHIGKISGFSFDGVARKASISCMFEREFIKKTLGYWDSVRFGADSEMIARAEGLLGAEFKNFKQISMICLDLETSLTNHPQHGIRSNNGNMSDSRKNYRESWMNWQKDELSFETAKLLFPQDKRRYSAVEEMAVSYENQVKNLS